MKLSEMNAHQKLAFMYVKNELTEVIGGYENDIQDNSPDSEAYRNAQAFLSKPHDELVNQFYTWVMASIEADAKKGIVSAKHAKFAGADFIKERIDRRLKKWGY